VLINRPAHNSGLAKAARKFRTNIQVYVRQPSPSRKTLPASATLVLRIKLLCSKILNKKPPHFCFFKTI